MAKPVNPELQAAIDDVRSVRLQQAEEEQEAQVISRLLCWFGFHRWRLGRLHEYPKGFLGCARCGQLKRFNIFE
jgi:hypothetical protein